MQRVAAADRPAVDTSAVQRPHLPGLIDGRRRPRACQGAPMAIHAQPLRPGRAKNRRRGSRAESIYEVHRGASRARGSNGQGGGNRCHAVTCFTSPKSPFKTPACPPIEHFCCLELFHCRFPWRNRLPREPRSDHLTTSAKFLCLRQLRQQHGLSSFILQILAAAELKAALGPRPEFPQTCGLHADRPSARRLPP